MTGIQATFQKYLYQNWSSTGLMRYLLSHPLLFSDINPIMYIYIHLTILDWEFSLMARIQRVHAWLPVSSVDGHYWPNVSPWKIVCQLCSVWMVDVQLSAVPQGMSFLLVTIGVWGGKRGGGGYSPLEYVKRPFSERKKKQVIFGQNHLSLGKHWRKYSGNRFQPPPPGTKLVPYAYACNTYG